MVSILANLSRRAVNILLSMHQPRPDILRLLDRVLVLSGSGTLIFTGPMDAIEPHLADLDIPVPSGTLNLADFLLDTVMDAPDAEVARMVAAFERCRLARREQRAVASVLPGAPLPGKYVAGFGRQVQQLSVGLLRNAYRHPFLVATSYAATLVAAVALGIAFWRSGFETPVRPALC